MDTLITFASNVHIYDQFYTMNIDVYDEDGYDDVNSITQMDNSEDTADQLHSHFTEGCVQCQIVCTKHICALVCKRTEDNEFLTFNAQTMVQSIKSIVDQDCQTSITIYVYDNRQFADILKLLNIPFTYLLISFIITEDGDEIIRCQIVFNINQYCDWTIIVHFRVTSYKEFITFITDCPNVNSLVINEFNEPLHESDYSKVFNNINTIKLILNTCAQNKLITKLTINWCDYKQIITATMDCFKDSNIKHLRINHSIFPLDKLTRKLIQTSKLKKLYLCDFGGHTNVDKIDNNILSTCKVINRSNITKLKCLFESYSKKSFIQFCKLVSFKKNFKVLALKGIVLDNIKHIVNILNNTYYIEQLNIYIGELVTAGGQYIRDFENYFKEIIDHLDHCITIKNITLYKRCGDVISNDTTDVITKKLQNNAIRRSAIRCTLLIHKIKDNLVARLPKCLFMYLIKNYF